MPRAQTEQARQAGLNLFLILIPKFLNSGLGPNVRPQYSDRINRINGIKEKGYKYPENHVNPVKITW